MVFQMKTVSVALVLCLNVGVDPPDIVKTQPCAKLECWIGNLHVYTYLLIFLFSLIRQPWLRKGNFHWMHFPRMTHQLKLGQETQEREEILYSICRGTVQNTKST